MHYIRLLRSPYVVTASRPGQASSSSSSSSLALVLTITTDLGESFLCPDTPIGIAVELVVESVEEEEETDEGDDVEKEENGDVDGDGDNGDAEPKEKVITHVFNLPISAPAPSKPGKAGKPPKTAASTGTDTLAWMAGMRVLKLEAKLPKAAEACLWDKANRKRRVCIRPADLSLSAVHARQLVDRKDDGGLIMPMWVDVPESADDTFSHVALRRLAFDYSESPTGCVEVEEEIGESIARHVWDAGLVAVAYLADTCMGHKPSRKRPREEDGDELVGEEKPLPDVLRSLLLRQRLRVLELGSGVGILGIGLAGIVHEAAQTTSPSTDPTENTFLLTDLPEAEERARANMARSTHLSHSLEYENLDWEDGREGRFGPAVKDGRNWDLVVLSDCTYNVDMLPALVETLSALENAATFNKSPQVFLARKPRHASEEALFALMKEHGWTVRASSTVPLPVLDNDPEVVELYLYER